MPLEFPPELMKEKNKLASSEHWLLFFEVQLTDGTVIRIVQNTEDVWWFSDFYAYTDLIRHFKLNDNAATTTVIESVQANNGTAQQNTSALAQTGKVNGALSFNGSSDYVDVDFSSWPITGQVYTASAWFRVDGGAASRRFLFESSPSLWPISLEVHNDDMIRAHAQREVGYGFTQTFMAPVLGTWYHVTSRYEHGVLDVYIDGVHSGTSSSGSGNLQTATGFHIGTYRGARDRWFNGLIDDVRIYDRAISETEIKMLHGGGYGTERVPALFKGLNFAMRFVEQSGDGSIPSAGLAVGNVNLFLAPYLRTPNLIRGAEARLGIGCTKYPNLDPTNLSLNFTVLDAVSDEATQEVVFTLGGPSPLTQRYPTERYLAKHCRHPFNDVVNQNSPRCGYTGKAVEGVTLPSGSEVSIEITGHGFLTGDEIKFTGVGGTTELNSNTYTITKTDGDNFTLDNTDGDDFTAWTSGGTAGYDDCLRIRSDCTARENTTNWGGFPGIRGGTVRFA